MAAITSASASWGGHTYAEVETYIKGELADRASLVASATNNNFAALDGNGDLKDSGSKAADFATAAQGALADTAVQPAAISDMATKTWVGSQGFASKYLGTITGDGETTEFTVTHSLDTTFVIVQVQSGASPYGVVTPTVAVASADAVTVTFAEAPADEAVYKVLVIG